ncbi:succinyl-diaminopimelate desuccinylase [Methylomarinovum caldicuralii]|uniref:Succinyl-diaminopimelate desuccinylase n=1 Tax=Methylomarinovum caldicuralii TaxID=438856 RepID=A0AAU9C5E4_9GAMM|nr:succinyl-diaminopimelate desuccinylase [Methylomarinovum caldicuralii]BCX82329.1 succinyl-diaminopimelate desuccinylase [Methylomarinovum caldicuralii]
MSETLELAKALIARPSLTPEDAGCMELVVEKLEPSGFEAEFLDFGDTRNLWLRRGSTRPLLVFLGHTDVVPPGDLADWTFPPFEPHVHEGKLYGRGAADMKGAVAAFTVACRRFVEKHPDHAGSIAVLLTSDEEGIAVNGVVKVVEVLQARDETIDWCLVGEPSSEAKLGDMVKIGRRGSLTGMLRVFGVQGHVAYPHKARNPIHQFAPALNHLVNEVWDEGNDHFPLTTFQIANIEAGTGAENVIPGHLDVQFNFRFSTELSAGEIQRRVTEILDHYGLDYELDWRLSGNPFLTAGDEIIGAVQQALREVLGHEAELSTAGGTSDGRFIAPTGAQVLELGPVNATIHQVNEHVAVADLDALTEVYERVLGNLLLRR